jgi:hypothetical protein
MEECLGVVGLDQRRQVDLGESILLVGSVLVVQPPQPAVGQDASPYDSKSHVRAASSLRK